LEKFEMKKSLIALAVLAASGAAMAQSTVTLYGIADVWVGSVKTDDGTTSTSTTSMISGGVSTSRWGMKGTEDLSGGLKANFQLEASVAMDTGAAGSATGFDRQAWVGFSGGFGEVRLGRVGSPFDNAQGASDGVFDSDLAPANNPGAGVFRTSNGYTSKPTNSIFYKTPSMGGFGAEVSYALAEDNKDLVLNETAITSLNVTYAAGPLAAQFAYQTEDRNVVADDDFTFMRLGASYNFGAATAKFSYGRAENATGAVGTGVHTVGASTDEWQIGVDVPLSSALTLSGSYATSTDDKTLTTAEVTRSGFGLGAAYSLSKRTTVYGGFKMVTDEMVARANDIDTTVFAVGVKHTF
jgi:predicted porin